MNPGHAFFVICACEEPVYMLLYFRKSNEFTGFFWVIHFVIQVPRSDTILDIRMVLVIWQLINNKVEKSL